MKPHHKKALSSQSGNRLCHGKLDWYPKASKIVGTQRLEDIPQESGTEIDYSLQGQNTRNESPSGFGDGLTRRRNTKPANILLSACIGVTSVCEYFTSCKAQHLHDNIRCYQNPIGCNIRQWYNRWGENWREIGI